MPTRVKSGFDLDQSLEPQGLAIPARRFLCTAPICPDLPPGQGGRL